MCTATGGQCGDGYHCTADGQCVGDGACTGLGCQVVKCEDMGMPATKIKGTIFAPNGTLPLYGIQVYVPNSDPGPLPDGAICDKCSDTLPGDPVVQNQSTEDGTFELDDAPSGDNIPLVIVSGKWRRIITIPHVGQCMDNMVPTTDTALPKSITDMTPNTKSVNMPKIAITTGGADSLECLVRRLGIIDSEITTSAGTGHIHLYAGNGVSTMTGGGAIPSATPFWSDVANLKPYDIVILSCEGAQNGQTKPQAALDAMKAYADLGGRVFASHWHNIWIEGDTEDGTGQKPAVWPGIATWSNGGNLNDPATDIIDEANNPKGSSFATWMLNVMGSTTRDQIPILNGTGRATCAMVDNTKAERWVYNTQGGGQTPQNFQFTTPNEADPSTRCGKVVFSDMHVSGGPGQGDYPGECGSTLTLSPQEKALAFMFFDISSCVSVQF